MQTQRLKVIGMSCGGCVESVTNALKALDGIEDVSVSMETGEATVGYDERLVLKVVLRSAINEVGSDVGSTNVDAKVASKVNAPNASHW